jgi:hypothetical protein
MMYEYYIATFSVSITIGLYIGHRLGKSELRLEYERGYMDGIWYV